MLRRSSLAVASLGLLLLWAGDGGTGGDDPNEEPTGGGSGSGTSGTGGNTGTTGDGPVAAVPEPTAALLFGVGAVVFARRRSRHGR